MADERKVSVDVPRHFKDGANEVNGGLQEVPLTVALKWEAAKKCVILDATAKAPEKPKEASKESPEKSA